MGKSKKKTGDGSLRLRSDGRWEGRIVVGRNEKGYPIAKSVTSKSKEDCLKKLQKLKEDCGHLTRKPSPAMPFGDWMDLWYRTYSKPSIRITTQNCYENRIYQHIIPEIGHIPLDKLTQNDLQQFYSRLKKNGRQIRVEKYGPGLSDTMIRACHTTCRTALERAVTDGLIKKNPAIGCKLPPKKAKEMQVLTHGEMERFLLQAKAEGFLEQALLELSTGLRRGELCGLQWDDLNFKTGSLHICRQVCTVHGQIHISEPKTKASIRTVILPPPVVELLRQLRERTPSPWMFPNRTNDGPLCPSGQGKRLKNVLAHAHCKDIRFHDLRHTFATTALENGMDIKTLSAIIGHVSCATTIDIYSHITDTMQIGAADKIEQGFGCGEAYEPREGPSAGPSDTDADREPEEPFTPVEGRIRRSGTGGVYKKNDNLYEGRFTPTNAYGKKEAHNVYAHTREECEKLLAAMIIQVKADIAAEKQRLRDAETATV